MNAPSPNQKTPGLPLVIAGPCAAETPEQAMLSIREAAAREVDFVRLSLWKPRTKPGFDGLKEEGIPLLAEAARMGINPATEVLTPEQAQAVMDGVLPALNEDGRLMLWIGARNQNHQLQQDISRAAAQDARVVLMIKNQPWPSQEHWEGIVEHALAGGIRPENLMLCHRGFIPADGNPQGLRNVPDSPMAMRVKAKTALPMVLDLSHTAGAVAKIPELTLEALRFAYDGIIVEVHPNPRFAWTDAKQQITWEQLDVILEEIHSVHEAARKIRQA